MFRLPRLATRLAFAAKSRFRPAEEYRYGIPNSLVFSSNLVQIDLAKRYRLSASLKTIGGTGTLYSGYIPYDADRSQIQTYHVYRYITPTTLAAPLTPGDTTVQLASPRTAWYNSTSATFRYFAVYGYKTQTDGFTHTDGPYTRYVVTYPAGGIVGDTLTLSAPWPAAFGNPDHPNGTWPVGTRVANHANGGSYPYSLVGGVASTPYNGVWVERSAEYGGDWTHPTYPGLLPAAGKWWSGTRYVRWMALPNHANAAWRELAVKNLALEEIPWVWSTTSWGVNVTTAGTEIRANVQSVPAAGTVPFRVDWGDGTTTDYFNNSTISHIYTAPYTGPVTISFAGANIPLTRFEPSVGPWSFNLDNADEGLTRFVNSSAASTITGTYLGMPRSLAYISLSYGNFTGDMSELPPDMTYFVRGSSTTGNTSGGTADIPRQLATLQITSANTLTGDVADLPPTLTSIYLWGTTTISGDVAGLPPLMTYLRILGNNTLSGDLANIVNKANFTTVEVNGYNTLTGDVAEMPNVAYWTIHGWNTVGGNILSIKRTATTVYFIGYNTLTGDIADCPAGALFNVQGNNTLSGTLAGYFATRTAAVPYIYLQGSFHNITGDITDIPATCGTFGITGGVNVTITGNLANLPAACKYFVLGGSNYVTGTINPACGPFTRFVKGTAAGRPQMTAAEVNAFLVLQDSFGTVPISTSYEINLNGNQAPTGVGLTAKTALQSRGWLVYTA